MATRDPLSDALADLRVTETSVARVSLRPPWGYRLPGDHRWSLVVVVEGECWLAADDAGAFHLVAGDLAIIQRPRSRGVTLRSPAGAAVLDTEVALAVGALSRAEPPDGSAAQITDGRPGDGQSVLLLAGYRMRSPRTDPMLDQLPPIMHLASGATTATLTATLALLTEEFERPGPGSAAVIDRLSEVLLIHVMHSWAGGCEDERQRCWLMALDDRVLSPALTAMHGDSGTDWTVTALAAHAGLSRAQFAHRFARATGSTPAAYLTRLRMTHASRYLEDTGDTVGEIAHRVGYRSTAAFVRAFARAVGSTPTEHRRVHRTRAG